VETLLPGAQHREMDELRDGGKQKVSPM
jgi:hypothetical protein